MTDAPGLINALIQQGGRALDRPVSTLHDADMLARLAADVHALVSKVALNGRDIHDTEYLLAQALVMHARAVGSDGPRAAALQQVIGVLLPIAREHYGEAMAAARANSTMRVT